MGKTWLCTGVAAMALMICAASAQAAPAAVWTPSAKAPQGLLSPIEAPRHDVFIERAKKASSCSGAPLSEKCHPGGIDLVLFGSTPAEMWWWSDRGMPVWEKAFASRKAVNFGTAGTCSTSLLWRMQNGELDGYQAKLVVLQISEVRSPPCEDYAPVIAEIRARQPQAKILVFTTRLPQQGPGSGPGPEADLADNQTVFYARLPEPLVLDREGYETWAQALEPWLKRFLD
jgi:hypothetical protein